MTNKARSRILEKLSSANVDDFARLKSIPLDFVESADSLVALLTQKLEAVQGSVEQVDSVDEISGAVVRFLQSFDGLLQIQRCPGTMIDNLVLDQGLSFSLSDDYTACKTILTQAECAIAETGSLVMSSNSSCPAEANFLPDNCIILLNESDILPYMEDALRFIQTSEGALPRALNIISGPSKTADIEQTLVYGAHGPIRLHLIIVGS